MSVHLYLYICCFFFVANLTHIQQQPQSANRTELEAKFKQEKEEMDRQLLSAAQQILQQRLVGFIYSVVNFDKIIKV